MLNKEEEIAKKDSTITMTIYKFERLVESIKKEERRRIKNCILNSIEWKDVEDE